MTQPNATVLLDCRGVASPMPVIRLAKVIKTVTLGGVVEMFATDRGVLADLVAFERQTGHRIVEQSESNGVFRVLIRRSR